VFDDLSNVVDLKGSSSFDFVVHFEFTHSLYPAAFPNPCCFVVGADAKRVAPGMNGNKSVGNCGCYVHRAAVYANGELRLSNQADQLQQRGLIGEINTIFRRRKFPDRFPNHNNAFRRKGAAELLDDCGGERFPSTTSKRMQKNEG